MYEHVLGRVESSHWLLVSGDFAFKSKVANHSLFFLC